VNRLAPTLLPHAKKAGRQNLYLLNGYDKNGTFTHHLYLYQKKKKKTFCLVFKNVSKSLKKVRPEM
jgi:hypothetical protein